MSEITPDDLRLLVSGIGDKYYTASKNIESWVTLRIPLECKPTLDNALKLAYNLVRCKDCKYAPLNLGEKCDPAKIKWPDASYFADPNDECCPYSCGDPWYSIMPQPDWYCWKGERREANEAD